MDDRVSAPLTLLRAAMLTVVVVGFGTVAHVSADGRLPSVPGFVALTLLCLAASVALMSRPAGALRIVTLTVLGQAGVHVALTLVAGHGAVPTHGHAVESHAQTGPLAHLLSDLTAANAPMLALHLAAALGVGLWLAVGERALWTVLALTGASLVGVLALAGVVVRPLVGPGRTAPAPHCYVPPRRPAAVVRCVVRRGPPALLAA